MRVVDWDDALVLEEPFHRDLRDAYRDDPRYPLHYIDGSYPQQWHNIWFFRYAECRSMLGQIVPQLSCSGTCGLAQCTAATRACACIMSCVMPLVKPDDSCPWCLDRAICKYLDSDKRSFGDYARSHTPDLHSLATEVSGQDVTNLTAALDNLSVQ